MCGIFAMTTPLFLNHPFYIQIVEVVMPVYCTIIIMLVSQN